MANKEAVARIKINKLLEAAGWRFFADGSTPANIQLEPSVKLKPQDLDSLGENFEKTNKGYIDFLMLDTKGFPLIVLEAKSEDKNLELIARFEMKIQATIARVWGEEG